MSRLFNRLKANREGSVAIEFALIGPVFLAAFLGVLQLGLGMQNYNALRSISAEAARYAAVNKQKKQNIANSDIEAYATSIATTPPYGLQAARFSATVTTPTTQRVTGATEMQIAITYRVPSLISFIGVEEIPLTYTRPIFLFKT